MSREISQHYRQHNRIPKAPTDVVVCLACARARLTRDARPERHMPPRLEPRSVLSPAALDHRERMIAYLARL